ncbi:heme/hemin ABC transporter substrate-binding protein [Cyclobacterium amurskyense]|uniref:ABC-type transporter, periplasmic subunit n=1 Tax=Cyclobacterium amurskyense TaxID=320787 RepID=A0A0H4PAY8_9BACT|nr:ABC transporter substrate-binding protein [Cyclobacterium amurskyense]AKP51601.1 ABC-type transporter, periplasmic subunit [Cyclobacterium amurskyense]
MKGLLLTCLTTMILLACSTGEKKTGDSSEVANPSIVTAGGTLTEIVYTLGLGDRIIATDRTSTYPEKMQSLPSIGYRNQIKAEGILSLAPDIILAEEDYLSDDVVDQLKLMDLEVHFFKKPENPIETKTLVSELAALFEVPERGIEINEGIDKDLQILADYLADNEERPSAAFVMARGPETLFVAGENTFAETIFNLAGIRSSAQGFEDFVPLTPESLVTMSPEYLVLFDSGLESLGGIEGMARIQGIKETKAYQESQVLSFDGHYLSGLGPRVGQVALELAKAVRNK